MLASPWERNMYFKIITILFMLPAFTSTMTINSEKDRLALVEKIIKAGRRSQASTAMSFSGDPRTYEVMNDNLKLEDGTYLPFTIIDARRIAKAWNCTIPRLEKLRAIAEHAYLSGNQLKAQTYLPNDRAQRYLNSNKMMKSKEMQRRSQLGNTQLIDGHFKWYTNDGKIWGFAKGDGTFYHNWPSGRHRSDRSYFDYSHGVRLICPN